MAKESAGKKRMENFMCGCIHQAMKQTGRQKYKGNCLRHSVHATRRFVHRDIRNLCNRMRILEGW